MGKRLWMRTVALGLAVCVWLSGCGLGEDGGLEPTEQTFSQIEYQRPDGDAVLEQIQVAQDTAQSSILPFSLVREMNTLNEKLDDFLSMYVLAQIHNSIDVTDPFYSEELEVLDAQYVRIQAKYNEFYQAMSQTFPGRWITGFWDDATKEDQETLAQTTSQDVLQWKEEEDRLIAQYHYQYNQITVEVDGEPVQYASLEPELQEAYYREFLENSNQQLGQILVDLVENRDTQARTLGYDSYVEMADDQMLRVSYDREQIRQYREDLKTTLVPLYRSMLDDLYARLEQKLADMSQDIPLTLLPQGDQPDPSGGWQEMMDTLDTVYSQMDPEVSACFSYLREHEMMEVAPSSTKQNTVYTTFLPKFNTPFLFANLNGGSGDVSNITHEFGHCLAIWLQLQQGSTSEGRGMDVSEIHSQSMEMLTLPWYDLLYDTAEEAQLARQYAVCNLLVGILSAAMDDEFQEELYQNPGMTVEEINQCYGRLGLEYGLMSESEIYDREMAQMQWTQVNHYFATPFYSIDYAVSGGVALEMLALSLEDYDAALDTYLTLCRQDANKDFLTVVADSGLSNPMEKTQLQEIASLCSQLMEEGDFLTLNEYQQEAA